MKQYCRYCANLCYGDFPWCEVKQKEIRVSTAKSVNHCKDFLFNELDAFGGIMENGKFGGIYKPRKTNTKIIQEKLWE